MKDDDGRMGSAVIAILVCRVYNYGRFLGGFGLFRSSIYRKTFFYIQLIEIYLTHLLSLERLNALRR